MALSQENYFGEELVVCSFQRAQPGNTTRLNLGYGKFSLFKYGNKVVHTVFCEPLSVMQ